MTSNFNDFKKAKLIISPRTPSDFGLLYQWICEGKTVEQIMRRMSNDNWRSEVIELPHKSGNLCGLCLRLISNDSCLECGMTIFTDELEFV